MRRSRLQSSKRSDLLALRAHAMRVVMSEPEQKLWRCIRAGQLGVSFKRQVVIGERYIADFVSASIRLAVEVDGPHHTSCHAADARRDRVFARLGYRVLRVHAERVMRELPSVLECIRREIEAARSA
jgi:very-short-patch-repair endonuclease